MELEIAVQEIATKDPIRVASTLEFPIQFPSQISYEREKIPVLYAKDGYDISEMFPKADSLWTSYALN